MFYLEKQTHMQTNKETISFCLGWGQGGICVMEVEVYRL